MDNKTNALKINLKNKAIKLFYKKTILDDFKIIISKVMEFILLNTNFKLKNKSTKKILKVIN